jgi:hypothetical protein
MKLEVPFYKQTMDFTCGAACLVMVLSFFDCGFVMGRDSEMDLWREGTSVLALGMGRYGISLPLLRRNYTVKIRTNVKGIEFLDRISKRLTAREMSVFREIYAERKERAIRMGLVEEETGDFGEREILDALNEGNLPVLLTNASALGDEEAPHWIVVTGIDHNSLYFNNPLDEKGSALPLSEFSRTNGFHGEKILIVAGMRKSKGAVTSYS